MPVTETMVEDPKWNAKLRWTGGDARRYIEISCAGMGSTRELLLHQFFHPMQDFVFGQAGGVEDERVRGGDQRRCCASAIAAVAFAQFSGDQDGGGAFHFLLLEPALFAHDWIGIEKDFHVGSGKTLGADVTAFHHYAA